MNSLRARIRVLAALAIAAAAALGLLLFALFRSDTLSHLARTDAVLAAACGRIRDAASFYAAGSGAFVPDTAADARALRAVLAVGLRGTTGVEAAIRAAGAERARVGPAYEAAPEAGARLAAEALAADETVAGTASGLRVAACELPSPYAGAAAWLAARPSPRGGLVLLLASLAVLLLLLAGLAVGLARLRRTWDRGIAAIETALATTGGPGGDALAVPPPTGERELDRVVSALADARTRLAASSLAAARAERLASFGRFAAGIVHEIRNPIAAVRLRAENALAAPEGSDRPRRALDDALRQIGRVEALLAELLDAAAPRAPALRPMALRPFVASRLDEHRDRTQGRALLLEPGPDATAAIDPEQLGRALDNLLLNALGHAAHRVTVRLEMSGDRAAIVVADDGPGVPEALRATLFEPFATGRPDGTGLGLTVAREIAVRHGGTLALAPGGGGARFALVLPVAARES